MFKGGFLQNVPANWCIQLEKLKTEFDQQLILFDHTTLWNLKNDTDRSCHDIRLQYISAYRELLHN